MIKFKDFLDENTFWSTPAERDAFIKDKEKLAASFTFSFMGMLGLLNAAKNKTQVQQYFKKDKKLRPTNIGDENLNISLIIKTLYDEGAFRKPMTVNEITRFLVNLKSGKIDTVNSEIVQGWAKEIKPAFLYMAADTYLKPALKEFLTSKTPDLHTLALRLKKINRLYDSTVAGEFQELVRRVPVNKIPGVDDDDTTTPASTTQGPNAVSTNHSVVSPAPHVIQPNLTPPPQTQRVVNVQPSPVRTDTLTNIPNHTTPDPVVQTSTQDTSGAPVTKSGKVLPTMERLDIIRYFDIRPPFVSPFEAIPVEFLNLFLGIQTRHTKAQISEVLGFQNHKDGQDFIYENQKYFIAVANKWLSDEYYVIKRIKTTLTNSSYKKWWKDFFDNNSQYSLDKYFNILQLADLYGDDFEEYFGDDYFIKKFEELKKTENGYLMVKNVGELMRNWIALVYKGSIKNVDSTASKFANFLTDTYLEQINDDFNTNIIGELNNIMFMKKNAISDKLDLGAAEVAADKFLSLFKSKNEIPKIMYNTFVSTDTPFNKVLKQKIALGILNKISDTYTITRVLFLMNFRNTGDKEFNKKFINGLPDATYEATVNKIFYANNFFTQFINPSIIKSSSNDEIEELIDLIGKKTKIGKNLCVKILFNTLIGEARGSENTEELRERAIDLFIRFKSTPLGDDSTSYLVIKTIFDGCKPETAKRLFELMIEPGNNVIKTIFSKESIKSIRRQEEKSRIKQIVFEMFFDVIKLDSDLAEKVFDEFDTYIQNGVRNALLSANAIVASVEKSEITPKDKISAKRLKTMLEYNDIDIDTILKENKPRKSKSETWIQYFNRAQQLLDSKEILHELKVTDNKLGPREADAISIKLMEKHYAARHGRIRCKVIKSFDVHLPEERYQEFARRFEESGIENKIIEPAFHGTGGMAACMILRYGFRVIKEGDTSVVGRMLGDGIYFAIHMDKSLQYVGNSGYSRGIGTVGYIFQMKAQLGEKNKDYAAAGLGRDHIRSPEWVVRDGNAQLKILKAYEVEMIREEDYQKIKSSFGVLAEGHNTTPFRQYIEEQMNPQQYEERFIFWDGNIPLADGTIVPFEEAKMPKGVKIEKSRVGPVVVFKSDIFAVHDVRYADKLRDDLAKRYFELMNK